VSYIRDRIAARHYAMPHPYDVIVYQESSHYYAKDNLGNLICADSPTACIQEAINYVLENGGGKVYLRKGVYRTNRYINIRGNNVELYGDGMGQTVIENYSTLDPAIYVGWDNQTSIIARNIYIHDLTIDAKYQYDPSNPKGNGNSTLWAYYVSDLRLERIEHKNAYWRTSITPGSVGCGGNCIQENIIIKENVFQGVSLTLGGITNLVLENNIFYGSASSPDYNTIMDFSFGEYQDSYIYNATVRGNIFYRSGRHPYNRVGWASVVAGFIRVVGASWIGNVFIDPDAIAVYVQDVTASGTTLDVRGVEFIGNVIIGQGRLNNAIVVKQKNVIIKGNYIENTNDVAISITNGEAVIEGNYINETASAGIWVSNSRAIISGNMMKNCAQSRDKCIILDGTSSYSNIIGNKLFRDITTYLPRAVDTSASQGLNIIIGNIAEGQWSSPKYATYSNDTVANNI